MKGKGEVVVRVFLFFFVSCLWRWHWVRKSAIGKYAVFRERAVVEGLVDFRRVVSGYGVSVCGFGSGCLCHGRIKRENFRLVLCRSWDALAARTIFRIGEFFFSRVTMAE